MLGGEPEEMGWLERIFKRNPEGLTKCKGTSKDAPILRVTEAL